MTRRALGDMESPRTWAAVVRDAYGEAEFLCRLLDAEGVVDWPAVRRSLDRLLSTLGRESP